jgi:hypothetical protein
MFDQSYASPSALRPAREILIGKRRCEASHDGGILHACTYAVLELACTCTGTHGRVKSSSSSLEMRTALNFGCLYLPCVRGVLVVPPIY